MGHSTGGAGGSPASPRHRTARFSHIKSSSSTVTVNLLKMKKSAHKKVLSISHAYSKQVEREWKGILSALLLTAMTYAVGLLIVGEELLPYSPGFAVFILFVTSHFLGWVASMVRLPPLLGMLLAGVLLKNLPGDPVQGLTETWSATIRVAGLSIIFIRSGLELDWRAFKKIGMVAVRLTVIPGVSEALLTGLAAMGFFQMNVFMGLTLGFILAAVSPAVVVNGMFALQKAGYGVAKGIPSLVVAAASFDDVVAITGYSLFIGLAVPSGSLALSIAHGPLNVVLGMGGGTVGGLLLSLTKLWRHRWQRSFATFITGQLMMAFFVYFHFKGAGAMASLVMGITAMICWEAGWPSFASLGPSRHYAHQAEADMAMIWKVFGQPLLFSVIGTAMDFSTISTQTIPFAIAIIGIGLAVRLPAAWLVVYGAGLSTKERMFIALSWIPKATVQAALASAPLDVIYRTMMTDPNWMGECSNPDSPYHGNQDFENFCVYEDWANDIIATAVFAIIITAPIGLIIFENLGPKWLTKDTKDSDNDKPTMSNANAAPDTRGDDTAALSPPDNAAGQGKVVANMGSHLHLADLHLQKIVEMADGMHSHDDESASAAAQAELKDALVNLRRHLVEIEFANTPADMETAGQFFRIQEMEKYWAETNKQAGSSSRRSSGSGSNEEVVEEGADVDESTDSAGATPGPDQEGKLSERFPDNV